MTELPERLAEVRERIEAARRRSGRSGGEVGIVAVTKEFDVATVQAALDAGLQCIGENRAQDLLDKAERVSGPEWHFLGQIQRNKIARLAPVVAVWHSVDRLVVAEAIAHRAPGARVYLQVNVGDEPQKGGCPPGSVPELASTFQALGLSVEGLMTVPPRAADPRPHFVALRELALDAGLEGLSMGMSDDYEVAVEEGATVVRLGSALFGPRPR